MTGQSILVFGSFLLMLEGAFLVVQAVHEQVPVSMHYAPTTRQQSWCIECV